MEDEIPDKQPANGRPGPPKSGDHDRSDGKVSASPQHRRARRDRGEDTRQNLIRAALDVFGRQGFEGSSTRQIAQAADANLAAIVYHFGGKEALHIAVAEYVAISIQSHVGPVLRDTPMPETPEDARTLLTTLVGTMADVLLGEEQAEQWARFIVREQLQPTAAFDTIYRFMGATLEAVAKLVSLITGKPDDEHQRVLAFTIFGQILVFRVAQEVVLRRLGWTAVGARERELIKKTVIANIHAILDAEAAS